MARFSRNPRACFRRSLFTRWWIRPSMFSFDRGIRMERARYLKVAELATVFVLIMLYIWRLRYTTPRAWIYILAAVVASHILRRERTAGLGFGWRNFKECMGTL